MSNTEIFWNDLKTIEEEFINNYQLEKHFDKHVIREKQYPNISMSEYEKIADKLAATPVNNISILGFKSLNPGSKKIAYCKYDVKTNDFVVYNYIDNNVKILTMYKKSLDEYRKTKRYQYFDEIPSHK